EAEDGIRDFHVTGVQTCALPISGPKLRGRCFLSDSTVEKAGKAAGPGIPRRRSALHPIRGRARRTDGLGVSRRDQGPPPKENVHRAAHGPRGRPLSHGWITVAWGILTRTGTLHPRRPLERLEACRRWPSEHFAVPGSGLRATRTTATPTWPRARRSPTTALGVIASPSP